MPASPSTPVCFDYDSLDVADAQFIQQQTGEIRVLMKRTAQDIIEVGQKLVKVKERLEHGRFGDWLRAEFEWGEWTANKFMQVAQQFEFVKFTDLQIAPSALYLLAAPSTPKAVREEAIARAGAGESITYTAAKALKQKYATDATQLKTPKPESKLLSNLISQPKSSPTIVPPTQSGSKLEIVALRSQSQASAEEATSPEQSGAWWRLGGRHLLYCGDPNSPEILAQIATEKVGLLLAFPPTPEWQSMIRAEVRIMMTDYLPQCHNVDQLDEILESNILFNSSLGELVVGCFLPSPEILSIINRLDRRGILAEPDAKRFNAVISDWKRAGLKAERLTKEFAHS